MSFSRPVLRISHTHSSFLASPTHGGPSRLAVLQTDADLVWVIHTQASVLRLTRRGRPATIDAQRGRPAIIDAQRGQSATIEAQRGQPATINAQRGQSVTIDEQRDQPATIDAQRGQLCAAADADGGQTTVTDTGP